MAVFHVNASVINQGGGKGGAQGFAQYLEGQRGRDDMVEHGYGSLPGWAKDGEHFFAMADRYERRGGVVCRTYQITLPRELSPEATLGLAHDITATFFERYPHVWAVHNPAARDGSGAQPHLHIMFSTRRDDEGRERTPQAWFSRANPDGSGGVRKDPVWDQKRTLQAVRYETATLINATLEREGLGIAVTQQGVRVRELGRERAHYEPSMAPEKIGSIQQQQRQGREDREGWEQQLTTPIAWQEQKVREHIDVSRQAVLDHVRDRFWLRDRSPAREEERAASLDRAIDREYVQTGRERGPGRERGQEPVYPTRGRGQGAGRSLPQPLRQMTDDDRRGHSLGVDLWGPGRGRGR